MTAIRALTFEVVAKLAAQERTERTPTCTGAKTRPRRVRIEEWTGAISPVGDRQGHHVGP